MKRPILICIAMFIVIAVSAPAFAITGAGNPLKYISSCEMDFNNDNQPDIALLVETLLGRRLIILLYESNKSYDASVIDGIGEFMRLSCQFGSIVKETLAGPGEKESKTYKTPGKYIKLKQPESSSVVYFWDGDQFKEVWTAD